MSDGYLAMMRKAQRLAERLDAEQAERDERERQYAQERWDRKEHLRCFSYTLASDGSHVPCDQPVAYLGRRHHSWCAEHRRPPFGYAGDETHWFLVALAIRRMQELWRFWPEAFSETDDEFPVTGAQRPPCRRCGKTTEHDGDSLCRVCGDGLYEEMVRLLGAHPAHTLRRAGIDELRVAFAMPDYELQKLPNFGPGSLRRLREVQARQAELLGAEEPNGQVPRADDANPPLPPRIDVHVWIHTTRDPLA